MVSTVTANAQHVAVGDDSPEDEGGDEAARGDETLGANRRGSVRSVWDERQPWKLTVRFGGIRGGVAAVAPAAGAAAGAAAGGKATSTDSVGDAIGDGRPNTSHTATRLGDFTGRASNSAGTELP